MSFDDLSFGDFLCLGAAALGGAAVGAGAAVLMNSRREALYARSVNVDGGDYADGSGGVSAIGMLAQTAGLIHKNTSPTADSRTLNSNSCSNYYRGAYYYDDYDDDDDDYYDDDEDEELKGVYSVGMTVDGKITQTVRGGYRVRINQDEAFLPASQADLTYTKDDARLLDKEFKFEVLKCSCARHFVVSRKNVLLKEKETRRRKRLEELSKGQVVGGNVIKILQFGAIVDLGGCCGLVHITEISWNWVDSISDYLSVGQQVQVKIINIESDTGRIALSIRELLPNPKEEKRREWQRQATERRNREQHLRQEAGKLKIGEICHGVVKEVHKEGLLVAIGELRGLILRNEISYDAHNDYTRMFKCGHKVSAVVVNVSLQDAVPLIFLSIKRLRPDPNETFFKKHKVGEVIEGSIARLTANGRGLIVECEGVTLLLPGKFATSNPNFDLSSLVGSTERFVIVELNRNRMVVGSADFKDQQIKRERVLWKISDSEGLHCEFKRSIIFSPKTQHPGIDQAEKIAATVAAFMNSNGGTLYLGVKDNGEVVGVEGDFDVLNAVTVKFLDGTDDDGYDYGGHKNVDGFKNKLGVILKAYLGVVADSQCERETNFRDGRTCVAVHVPRSDDPVYFGAGQDLYVRVDNCTRRLSTAKEVADYMKKRFS